MKEGKRNKGRKNEFHIQPNNKNKIDPLFQSFSLSLLPFHSSPLLLFPPTKHALNNVFTY